MITSFYTQNNTPLRYTLLASCFLLWLHTGCYTKNIPAATAHNKQWKLVWQEEFNYTGLPDTTQWRYEAGHVRNREQQYYTVARKENVWVANGVLTITGRKEEYNNAFYKPGSNDWRYQNATASYTSASLHTLGKTQWQYGRIAIKAKLPQGAGMWPALWMMGTNRPEVGWPACGEIDIMEFIGQKDPFTIYGTVHYKNDTGGHTSSGHTITSYQLANDFHEYAIEWNKEAIDMYLDGKKYHHFIIDSAGLYKDSFRKPFYLLINLAMGGNWPGPVADAILPQTYQIDYVRVYQ